MRFQDLTPSTRALAIVSLVLLAAALVVVWWLVRAPIQPLLADWVAHVRVLAGTGAPGLADGPAWEATFDAPFGIAGAPDGTIYVADSGDRPRIRRVAPDGVVTTIAGAERGFRDGTGAAASFDTPSALAIGRDGVIYVADTGNHAIRRVTVGGVVTTVAGTGEAGYRDGTARAAQFNGPIGVAVDPAGRVIVADTYNDRIRALLPDGSVITLAGAGLLGARDGAALDATFDTPAGVASDRDGVIYVADTGNGAIRAVGPAGHVWTVDTAGAGYLRHPTGIAAAASRPVYVTDATGIIEIDPHRGVRRLAGRGLGFADGLGREAAFRRPQGVAVAGDGRLVVADTGNNVLRATFAAERASALPPRPARVAPAFDVERFAWQPLLWPVHPMSGPHEIAGTLGEARGEGGGRPDRLHAGIDIHRPEGTAVFAVREGAVELPVATQAFDTLNESLLVGAVRYVHVRIGRDHRDRVLDDPRFTAVFSSENGGLAAVRVRRGARFAAGEQVGTVNRFYHVHLNVGWPGEEVNPLLFRLPNVKDTIPPSIARRGVTIVDEAGEPFSLRKKGRLLVSGRVGVLVDAWDQMDGNPRRRRLGVYRLGYQLLDARGRPLDGFDVPRESIRFDRLTRGDEAARLVYAAGSGIPFYGQRRTRFVYAVTNTYRDGVATEGALDVSSLPQGDYIIRVLVADAFGNEAREGRDLPIAVVSQDEARGKPEGRAAAGGPGLQSRPR